VGAQLLSKALSRRPGLGFFIRWAPKKNCYFLFLSLFFCSASIPRVGARVIFDMQEEMDKAKLRRFDQDTKQTRGDGDFVINITFF